MELARYLKEKEELITKELSRLVPNESEFPPVIHEAVNYSLFAGGKRIRPILTLAAYEAVSGAVSEAVSGAKGKELGRAINTACAFECIHTYSLIHDDLPSLDDDDLRRGKPTCHKKFGEATAILAGDALLTFAFELIADSPGVAPEIIVAVTKEISRAAGSLGMIGGQVVDLESEDKDISVVELERIHALKTGALLTASIRCGAMIAGAGEKQLDALTTYGRAIGLAFQVADDILDLTGTTEELGKDAGSDEKLSKATYPKLVGLGQSREIAKALKNKAIDSLKDFGEEAEPLRAIAEYIVDRRK
ncbi:MAG: polyprenyl synthetase family protein [Deltaproteobacteria bacterium]|nr:polyprenyl synthetase family protein [Deltaproteobacteria bacterium]